jgi:hypothetical protein
MADHKRTDELTVITKTYDLIWWSYNHTGKFPAITASYAGGTDRTKPLRPIGNPHSSQVQPATSALLEKANLMLEILRFQIRLAKDLQCLKVESYGFAAKAIDVIGKLIGGRLKIGGKAGRSFARRCLGSNHKSFLVPSQFVLCSPTILCALTRTDGIAIRRRSERPGPKGCRRQ